MVRKCLPLGEGTLSGPRHDVTKFYIYLLCVLGPFLYEESILRSFLLWKVRKNSRHFTNKRLEGIKAIRLPFSRAGSSESREKK